MRKLKGVLIFGGYWLNRPWKLIQDDGSIIDLYPLIDEALSGLNGKPAEQTLGRESYSITANDSASYVVNYETDKIATLEKITEFGLSNIGAHLPNTLTLLSGREVEAEFSETGFSIAADPSEKVFGVKFFSEGNSCRIPKGAEKSVCLIGTPGGCIFMAVSSQGCTCEKFSMGALLLDKFFRGVARSSRVGNCACIGREE